MNYYMILGVARTADTAAIRSAFRALVRQYHPDAGTGSSPSRFREIVAAYETLMDPERRRRYDASLRPANRPARVEPLVPNRAEPLVPQPMRFRSRVVEIRRADRDLADLFEAIDRLLEDL